MALASGYDSDTDTSVSSVCSVYNGDSDYSDESDSETVKPMKAKNHHLDQLPKVAWNGFGCSKTKARLALGKVNELVEENTKIRNKYNNLVVKYTRLKTKFDIKNGKMLAKPEGPATGTKELCACWMGMIINGKT